MTQKVQPDAIPDYDPRGQKFQESKNPTVSMSQIERQLYKIDKGPRMLPRKQRFKVWGAFGLVGLWFYGCYSLLKYRLRADDLELMEREVYEELEKKKEAERLMGMKL